MKIINWQDLMKEPSGTIFQEYSFRNGLGELSVFSGPLSDDEFNNDYVSASFLPQTIHIDQFNNKELEGKIQNLVGLKTGMIISYPSGFGRDGYFDKTRFYLVWDKEDRTKFANWLLDPEKCANEMNDDPEMSAIISAEYALTGEEF